MSNVAVVVEDEPPRRAAAARPLPGRPAHPADERATPGCAPDKITIYRGPLERRPAAIPSGSEPRYGASSLHEIAHHFGISDERLRRARPLLSRILGGDETEHERLREPARVAAVRDAARVDAGDPDAVGRAGAIVDLHAAVGVRDRRVNADAEAAARQRLGLLRVGAAARRPPAARALRRRARTRPGRPAAPRSPGRGRSPTTTARRGRTPRRGRSRAARSGRRAGRRRRTAPRARDRASRGRRTRRWRRGPAPASSARSMPSPSLHGFERTSNPRSRASRDRVAAGGDDQRRLGRRSAASSISPAARTSAPVRPRGSKRRPVVSGARCRARPRVAEPLEPVERVVEPLPDEPLERGSPPGHCRRNSSKSR